MESNHPNPYYLLTHSVQRSLNSLIELSSRYRRLSHLSIVIDIAALAALAYGSKSISINPYSFLLYLMIASFLSYLGIVLIKRPKEDLKKATETFKGQLLFEVCDCYAHCHCRKWIRDYLRERHIKL